VSDMPPQPLSKVKPNAQITIGPQAISRYAKLAVIVMRVIAEWADIYGNYSAMLSSCLRADITLGTAMFQALTGGEARMAALKAVLSRKLSADDYRLFEAVLKATNESKNRRNDFAHSIWGWSSDIPNALLLMSPSVLLDYSSTFRQHIVDTKKPIEIKDGIVRHVLTIPTVEIDRSRIQVFREADLKRDQKAAEQASLLVAWFFEVVRHGDAESRKRLSSASSIAAILRRASS
jgi:hypothetical protein